MIKSKQSLYDYSAGKATSDDVYKAVCSDIVEHIGSTRASIWYFNTFGDEIKSMCLMDTRTGKFESGAVLKAEDFPDYFEAINKQSCINAPDAINHPATKCFDDLYFVPTDIYSLLDFVISVNDKQVAILCCEHCGTKKNWSEKDESYLRQMAVLLRLSFLIEHRKAA
jgi:two-component system, sensor histidine kinase